MSKVSRTVDEAQTELLRVADRLQEYLPGLELSGLMEDLERHHPDDPEPMGNDEVCPSVAWEVHGDVGLVEEMFREIFVVLQRAAGRTPEAVRAAWLRRRLAEEAPSAALAKIREALAELEHHVHEPEIADFRGSLAELGAHLRELVTDPQADQEDD